MSEIDDTTPFDDSTEDTPDEKTSPDPLGILGWVIGGKYKIERHIGGGGFGEVYVGHNVNLVDQRVVIKFFKRVQARDKFDKEARILSHLDHTNICRVIDYLPDEGAVVMAFIDGRDGSTILKESGALGEELFLNVARSVTAAIAYAHSKKIAHRDMKPGNIIVDNNNHVYLIDFGIAKQMREDATKTAYQALTPMVAAPERQQGAKNYNPFLSDIYEIGVTLFNFATDSLPYRNPVHPNFAEWGGVAAKRLSPGLTHILKKATHPDPRKRYQSSEDMAIDFKNLDKAYGSQRKFPTGIVVTAIIVIALAAAGWQYRDTLKDMFASFGTTTTEKTSATEPNVNNEEDSENPATIMDSLSGRTGNKAGYDASTGAANPTAADQGAAVVEEPQKPPPPPISNLIVNIVPSGNVKMLVDGKKQPVGKRFEIDPGSHDVFVMHPDFPVYETTITASQGDDKKLIDLGKKFPEIDTVHIQLALIPYTDKHLLEMTVNGRSHRFTDFPVLQFMQPAGQWEVTFDLKPLSQSASRCRVDSCAVVNSFGEKNMLRKDSGLLTINRDVSISRMLIFWSEK